jgi:rare lipoprotein A
MAWASESGIASYYQNPHYSGLIAAHKTLPFGTRVKVFNLDNGRSAIVRIVDRGPFIRGRIIDVSPAAANALGFRQAGLAHVRLERL